MRARAVAVAGAALVVGAVLALPAPTSAAAPPRGSAAAPPRGSAAAPPRGYAATTAGAALQVVSTQKPAFSIATGDLVDQTLALVASGYGSSTSEARAASYYPGDLLSQAGQLICGQFGPCPFDPPTYPLLAEASWPTVAHASAGHGTATASATSTSNTASTTAAGRSAGGLSVGSATSTTSSEARADGLHVRVRSVLHDIALGPLSVASVDVSDDVWIHPDGRRTTTPRVTASGATVAGTPVAITSTPLPDLAQQGLAVRLVGASADGARSGATGLRVDMSVPVDGTGAPAPGLPSPDRTYVGSFVLGQVSVVAARDESLRLPDAVLPALPSTAAPAAAPSALPPGIATVLPATAGGPPDVEGRPSGLVVVTRSFGTLDNPDLTDLYAVLAIGAVVGLVVSRGLSRRAWRETDAA